MELSSREELAWTAGFIDGEGHFFRDKRGASIGLAIAQTGGPQLLERVSRAVGGLGKITGPKTFNGPTKRSPQWEYRTSKYEHVQAIIAMVWPWLGDVKRTQAANAVLDARPMHRRKWTATHCTRGHEWNEQNTGYTKFVPLRGIGRYCRVCLRDRARIRYHEKRRLSADTGT